VVCDATIDRAHERRRRPRTRDRLELWRSVKPLVLARSTCGRPTVTGGEPTGRERACSCPSKRRKPEVKNRFCKPICKPDAVGQAEMGEMQKAGDDFTPEVGRGQRGDQRLPETAETHVGRLITQRSRVQIPPPLPRQRPSFEQEEGLLHVVC
jgi:hypothetical protein